MKTEIKRLSDIEPKRLKKMISNSVENGIIKISEKTIVRIYDQSYFHEMILATYFKDIKNGKVEYHFLTPEEVYFFSDTMDKEVEEVEEDNKILLKMWNEERINLYKEIATIKGFRKVKKETMKEQFIKLPTYFFNNFNSFTKVEFSIILFFINYNYSTEISTSKVYEKIGVKQSHFSTAIKSLIEKGVMKKITNGYCLVIPEEKNEPSTENENIGSGELLVEDSVPIEEIKITQPAVQNEPKKEDVVQLPVKNVFIDENGIEYSVQKIREIFDVTFLVDLPNYRTILIKYGTTYFFQNYGKNYFYTDELPNYFNMANWYLKNN